MKEKLIQHRLKDDDILYFLHIPKTAGTTLTTFLDDHFNYNKIFKEMVWSGLLKTKTDFRNYNLIRGHFGYGLYRNLSKKPLSITMLRDPIERTISFYHHINVDPISNNWVPKEFLLKHESLFHLLNDNEKKNIFTNNQTRHIALDLDVIKLAKSKKSEFLYESSYEFVNPNMPQNKLLEIAKYNLKDFIFFGLQEKFAESLQMLCYVFGWKPIKNISKYMVLSNRPKKKDLSNEVIKKIEEINSLDLDLYNYAKIMFENRYKQMINELMEKYYKKKYEKLQFSNVIYELLEKNYDDFNEDVKMFQTIDYSFREPLQGTGWYSREIAEDKKTIFRWTGPDKASNIDFPISKDHEYLIQFKIIMLKNPQLLDDIKIKVNDNLIKSKIIKKEIPIILEGIITQQSLENGKKLSKISIEINDTMESGLLNPYSPHPRKLGLAIEKIKVFPINSS